MTLSLEAIYLKETTIVATRAVRWHTPWLVKPERRVQLSSSTIVPLLKRKEVFFLSKDVA